MAGDIQMGALHLDRAFLFLLLLAGRRKRARGFVDATTHNAAQRMINTPFPSPRGRRDQLS